MDPTHGHPLGGGRWWTSEGYWPMLAKLRAAMAPDRMITTECNAEPYIRWMDGYLTWHWQYDGGVPAFPAVYGGAVQMFSRSYGAGADTRDLALCMKMGQQLCWGEQIGWLDPKIAEEPVAGGFLRRVVRMRSAFRRYFYVGEMARPPVPSSPVPTVKADWAWYGTTWVTTSALMTGAWKAPNERKLLCLFANVDEKPVSTSIGLDLNAYGVRARSARLRRIVDPDGPAVGSRPIRSTKPVPLALAPRSVEAWEITW
jgi:hypothetical protein